jgi:spore maturation protein CgeB
MKILVLGSIGKTSVEIAGFCKAAFEKLGHGVDYYMYDDRRITARWPLIKPVEKFVFHQMLLNRINSFRPDFIMTIKGDCLDAGILNRIRSTFSIPIVNYWIDDPFYLHLSKKVSPFYDIFFTNAEQCLEEHTRAGCKNVKFLSFGFDNKIHNKIVLNDDDKRRYGSDISFSGTLSDERIVQLNRLTNLDLKIWSKPEVTHITENGVWATPLPADHPLLPCITGTAVWKNDMVKVCNASKIVLNLHMQSTPTMRDFEVTACGAFLLTNYVKGLERFFVIGEEIECFHSNNELLAKIEHFLFHPDERKKIAQKGHLRTIRDHGYVERMKSIIGEVDRVRKKSE